MAYFNYISHNIYFEEIGTGKPLLVLHGNTASSVMFSKIALKYAQDYKVILIDFLGSGKSDRIRTWPEDLWFDEAMQVICFLDEKGYRDVNLIGTSGGGLVAINIALERPDLVNKLIADSFEGGRAKPDFTQALQMGREISKHDAGAKYFYERMHGADWEHVIDADTQAVISHANRIVEFFHKPLSTLKPEILLTGSKEDEFFLIGFYENLFNGMLHKIGHGSQHLFEHGGHPAMLSNQDEFLSISNDFFAR
ncbi:alpha/beta fold hydrolase [Acetobacterium carbinolicum]|uniref:alpha/beta fold hydrolase n=1 Tax=Acetobacterium carbinolicum TaxID=52690 RepID=UPI0039C9C475